MSEDADREERRSSPRLTAHQAIYLFGVARAKTWRGGRVAQVAGEDVLRVRYRDLDALVRPVPYEVPPMDEARVQAHQKVVEAAMRRGTVLPAPFGIVFRGRRQLIHLLQDQYLVLDEGLSFMEGHWELRLHMAPAAGGEDIDLELSDLAMQLYSELRRHARAAVPFAAEGRRLLSAAFLVERSAWIDFVDRAEDLGAAHDEITFDVTGPWPPYDFVRITV
ncbi:MAG TPA: GvpL/GvpF family gas vesicle protein [Longimicrobiales bacterium]|nr:GvpL/GvpF family gas vesicle protein [Longimicrobiales bacterium]